MPPDGFSSMPHSPQRRGRKNDTRKKRNENIPPPAEERSLRKDAGIRSLSRVFRRKRATPPGIRANGHRRILPDEAGRHHSQPARSMSRLLSDMRRSPPPACPSPLRHDTFRTGRTVPANRSYSAPDRSDIRRTSRYVPASRPSLTSAQLRTASVPRRTTPPKMPKVSLFRKYLPCKTGAKTSTGSSRLSATGSPFASRP